MNRAALIAGATLGHLTLLVAPVCAIGEAGQILRDPAVVVFLLLAGLLTLADAPAIGRDDPVGPADRAALATGLLLLATFWTALLETAWRRSHPFGISETCGALAMLGGVALRTAAVRSLGHQFVTAHRAGTLVQTGLHAHLRHPSESGNIAVALGACVLLGGRLAFLPAIALVILIFRRVNMEDMFLRRSHGRAFERYELRVGGLWPRWGDGRDRTPDPSGRPVSLAANRNRCEDRSRTQTYDRTNE